MTTDELIYGIQTCNYDEGLIIDTLDQWLTERGYDVIFVDPDSKAVDHE